MSRATRLTLNAALLIAALPLPATAGKYLPVKGYTAGSSGNDKQLVVAVAATPDGGYVAATGRSASNGGGEFIFKVSGAGALEWEADLRAAVAGSTGGSMQVGDIAVHSSGRIFVTGSANTGGSSSIYLAEISSGGAVNGVDYRYMPSGGTGWTLAIYGDELYLGGSVASNGYLEKFNVATGRVSNYVEIASLPDAVLGIAKIGSDIFVSYRDPSISNSTGFMRKCNEPTPTSFNPTSIWTTTGGGRAHISPDGYVYVASHRVIAGVEGAQGSSARITVVAPSTGAATMQEAQLNLQPINAGDWECCSYINGIVDFGFVADGTMVVAYDGVSGLGTYTSGVAGYGRQAESCGGSNCINWQFKWHQPSLAPYLPTGNSEIGSLAVTGSFAIVGANSINCTNDSTGCVYRYGVVVLDNALASNPPALGEMQIRRNVLRTDRGDQAVVVLKGEPFGNVTLSVYGPSGNVVAGLHGDDCKPAAGEACDIQLDADGNGAVSFDGKYSDHVKLRSGMYWIVASGGGIAARKPVIVRSGQ